MTALARWLDARHPRPPLDLAPWCGGVAGSPVPPTEALEAAARKALARALARPGRNREAAFDLLAADALLTYACEAALECAQPEAVLARLVEAGYGA